MQPQLLPSIHAPSLDSPELREPDSVAEIQRIVRDAIAEKRPIEPFGGGTQLHVGYASDLPLTPVSLRRLSSVIEYNPADLVVVAEAGMTLLSLQAILAEYGQTLPLEVAFPETQTLGGIVATRAGSLTRAGSGAVRDWLIGCNAVGGDGQVIVGGGKVVKNVAGYDLPKLYCGSWGTLGVLTQVAFKLAPLPASRKTLLVMLSAERNSEEALDALAQSAPPVAFAYLLNAQAAGALLGPDSPPAQYLVVGIDGLPEPVAAIARRVEAALAPFSLNAMDLPDSVAARLRSALRDLPARQHGELTVRCNILPSQVGAFARMLEWTARRYGFAAETIADAIVGIVWAHLSPNASDKDKDELALDARWMRLYPDLRDKIDRVGGSSVLERMPDVWRRAGTAVWSPVLAVAAYMRRLKAVFDPHGVFRPGRFFNHI